MRTNDSEVTPAVAIIGMAGRFPGAPDVRAFWENLRRGRESVTFFSDAELRAAGLPEDVLQRSDYVKAAPILEDCDRFDAAFFSFSRREATALDPQQRLFLECAWHALEDAGYAAEDADTDVGVFAGSGDVVTSYLLMYLDAYPELRGRSGSFQHLGNDKDYLATRVSYKFNLTGPSLNVQTACSSSLVAVHLAVQSLTHGECDLALAGGVNVRVPMTQGYYRDDGGIYSADGHCRPFDREADGVLFGSGLGVVVLKPLKDALRDRDRIYAVIKGTAINNDGGNKVSYTAAGLTGQARCMQDALAASGVDPRTVSYVEAHGTGTLMGDRVEVAALTEVFRQFTPDCGFCGLGSVKSNVGHLDAAAGIAGLIKTALALEHRELPPSINVSEPNPKIGFSRTPFHVVRQLQPWRGDSGPRRAAVNCLGIGGTNAFAVLEEPPELPLPELAQPERPLHVMTVSAKSETAAKDLLASYRRYVEQHPDVCLPDLAYTANTGRRHFDVRTAIVYADRAELIRRLDSQDVVFHQSVRSARQKTAFVLAGDGNWHRGMGKVLYDTSPDFRSIIETCECVLAAELADSLPNLLFCSTGRDASRSEEDSRAASIVWAYALATLWQQWLGAPDFLIGDGIGEVAAAALAGSISLRDAIRLVTKPGTVDECAFNPPEIAIISSATGQPIPDGGFELVDWSDSLRRSEKFGDAVQAIINNGADVFIEVGLNPALRSCLAQKKPSGGQRPLLCVPASGDAGAEWQTMLDGVRALYEHGVSIDWRGFEAGYRQNRRKVDLPLYPFQRQSYWVEEPARAANTENVLCETPLEGTVVLTDFLVEKLRHILDLPDTEPVDTKRSLLEYGLDSLMAVELRNELREFLKTKVALPESLFYEHPNIEALAAYIHEVVLAEEQSAAAAADTIRAVNRNQRLPLSDQEMTWWQISIQSPDNPVGSMVLICDVAWEVDLPRLEAALDEMIKRHEILRTAYRTGEKGMPYRDILDRCRIAIEHIRDGADSPELRAKLEASTIRKLVEQGFDLENPPLFRITCLTFDRTSHVVILCLHHIIGDGISLAQFANELFDFYRRIDEGKSIPREKLPVQYADYAWFQQELRKRDDGRISGYWLDKIDDRYVLMLPYNFGSNSRPSGLKFIELAIPQQQTHNLERLSKTCQVTLYTVLNAIAKVTLFRLYGQTHIHTGTYFANRTQNELQNVLGHFVVSRHEFSVIDPVLSFQGQLKKIFADHAVQYNLQDSEFYQLDKLIKERLPDSPSVMFDFHSWETSIDTSRIAFRSTYEALMAGEIVGPSALAIHFFYRPSGITCAFFYHSNLFVHDTIATLCREFEHVMYAILSNPSMPLEDLPAADLARDLGAPGSTGHRGPVLASSSFPSRVSDEGTAVPVDRRSDANAAAALSVEELRRRLDQYAD